MQNMSFTKKKVIKQERNQTLGEQGFVWKNREGKKGKLLNCSIKETEEN